MTRRASQNAGMKPSRLVPYNSKARLTTYLIALWKLFKHPETPRAARWTAIAVLAGTFTLRFSTGLTGAMLGLYLAHLHDHGQPEVNASVYAPAITSCP